MASSKVRPCLVMADTEGNIYTEPELFMLCRRGDELVLPRPDELIPMPKESQLFLLPGRHALGLDPESGEVEEFEDFAVAAFVTPGYTLAAHAAYATDKSAPQLPLFAYGAVGFANDRFYVAAKKVDEDPRQQFFKISQKVIEKKAGEVMAAYPENRLVQHIAGTCALVYGCPAAKNFCLGRYEAPLPISQTCNARCVGCISEKSDASEFCATPQSRLTFSPTAEELVEVMEHHARNEKSPIFSFGQGCEGEPLTLAPLMQEAISLFRQRGGKGTVNLNTNASLTRAIPGLAEAGLSSMRVSLNSAREESYNRYYRPQGFTFADVRASIRAAREKDVFVSLNLLFFPGFTDTEEETAALIELVKNDGVNFIQLRNMNIDPELYLELMDGIETGPCLGFLNFRKRLRKECPDLGLGYFNPYVSREE